MTCSPIPVSPDPKTSAPAPGATPEPLSPKEAHHLDLKTEREARRQAEVGQIVRGGGA